MQSAPVSPRRKSRRRLVPVSPTRRLSPIITNRSAAAITVRPPRERTSNLRAVIAECPTEVVTRSVMTVTTSLGTVTLGPTYRRAIREATFTEAQRQVTSFYEGLQCRSCGGTRRYKKSRQCVGCQKARPRRHERSEQEIRADLAEQFHAMARRWDAQLKRDRG